MTLSWQNSLLSQSAKNRRVSSFPAGDEKSLDTGYLRGTHRVSEARRRNAGKLQRHCPLLPGTQCTVRLFAGKMRIRCTKRTRSRESTPAGEIGVIVTPTPWGHDERAKPTTGKEPARACCTTWTSARNNTNHYDDGCSTAARAVGYLIERGPVWATSPPLTTHSASYQRESLSPLSVCRVVDGGRLASVLRYSWVGGSCSNIPHHCLRVPRPMAPGPPIVAGPSSSRIALDQSDGDVGVAVGSLGSRFESSHSRILCGAAASSTPPALSLNEARMLASLARAKPIIPRSGIGLRNSTRDARLHDARPCRVVPCRAKPCQAEPSRAGSRDARAVAARSAAFSSHLMSCQLSSATRLTTGTSAPCVREWRGLRVSSRERSAADRACFWFDQLNLFFSFSSSLLLESESSNDIAWIGVMIDEQTKSFRLIDNSTSESTWIIRDSVRRKTRERHPRDESDRDGVNEYNADYNAET